MFIPTAHITLYQRTPGLDCNDIDPQQQLDTTGTNHGNKKSKQLDIISFLFFY
jgi:hypothetical protein